MNYVEYVSRQTIISFNDAIELVTPIYLRAIQWNPNSDLSKVKTEAVQFIGESIRCNSESLDFKPHIDYIVDDIGYPELDHNGNQLERFNGDRSTVDCNKLLIFFHHNFVRLGFIVPDELLVIAGIEATDKKTALAQLKPDPAIATELGTLRNEKLKWDASIRAATEIGLLFFEGELPKPTTKDVFVKEFNSKVGGLPDTTVEMIYKALPSEYRHKGGKPKIAKTETAAITGIGDLHVAIKAAVFAGTVYEEREAKDVSKLSKMLAENKYQVPPVEVLEKIVEYVKNI